MEFVKSFKQTKLIKYMFIALLGSILLALSAKIKINPKIDINIPILKITFPITLKI